jgi:hypothetical protein
MVACVAQVKGDMPPDETIGAKNQHALFLGGKSAIWCLQSSAPTTLRTRPVQKCCAILGGRVWGVAIGKPLGIFIKPAQQQHPAWPEAQGRGRQGLS